MSLRTTVILILLAAIVGFLAGWWPQREARLALERELTGLKQTTQTAEAKAAAAESRIRAGALLGQALALGELIAAGDFARAQSVSTALFDGVRAETMAGGPFKAAMDEALALRDPVTAGLAKRDAASGAVVRRVQVMLRHGLGYPVDVAPGPASAQAQQPAQQ